MSEPSEESDTPRSKFRARVRWDYVGLWLVIGVLISLVGTPLACQAVVNAGFLIDPNSMVYIVMMIPFGWVVATFLPPGWFYYSGLFLAIANRNRCPL